VLVVKVIIKVIKKTIPGTKRKLITAPEKDPNEVKKQKKAYTPQSGKFSGKNNFRSYGGNRSRRGGQSRGGGQRFKNFNNNRRRFN